MNLYVCIYVFNVYIYKIPSEVFYNCITVIGRVQSAE